jgi:hypothetical protein
VPHKLQGQLPVAFQHRGHTAAFLFRIKDIKRVVLKNLDDGPGHFGEKIVGGATGKISNFAAQVLFRPGIQVLFFSPLGKTLFWEGWYLPRMMNAGGLFYQIPLL